MPGIRTLCFDIGQVLVRFDAERAVRRLSAMTSLDGETIWNRFRSSDLLARFEKGQLSTEAFHRAACGLLGSELPFALFCEIWADIFDPEANIPVSLLESLRPHYRMMALSNTDAIHFPFLRRRYELFHCFEEFILSYEVGARKPEPRIYEVAIERGGGEARAIFFVDDSAEYAAAGAALGLVTRPFRSLPGLLEDLAELGIWPLPKGR